MLLKFIDIDCPRTLCFIYKAVLASLYPVHCHINEKTCTRNLKGPPRAAACYSTAALSAARYPLCGDISVPFIVIEEWILEQCHGAERSQGVLGKDLYGSSLDQEVKCRHYRKHVLTFTVRANYLINVHIETAAHCELYWESR